MNNDKVQAAPLDATRVLWAVLGTFVACQVILGVWMLFLVASSRRQRRQFIWYADGFHRALFQSHVLVFGAACLQLLIRSAAATRFWTTTREDGDYDDPWDARLLLLYVRDVQHTKKGDEQSVGVQVNIGVLK